MPVFAPSTTYLHNLGDPDGCLLVRSLGQRNGGPPPNVGAP